MARGKKKRSRKYKLESLTTKAMCCINDDYCNTINDLEMLNALKQEIIRLYGTEEISPCMATSVMYNLSKRIVQVKGYTSSRIRIYYQIL